MTDPSFARQLITFTTAHVGNYGVSEAAMESDRIHAAGAIMRAAVDYDDAPERRAGLAELAARARHPGHRRRRHARAGPPHPLGGRDARRDLRRRRVGQRGARADRRRAEHGRPRPRPRGHDSRATDLRRARETARGSSPSTPGSSARSSATSPRAARRSRSSRARRTAEELLARDPDGFFLVPGPGDPAALDYIVANIRTLLTTKPVFGICLGHQLLSRAAGLDTFKLPFGHRGANHPVKDLRTGRIAITQPEPRLRGRRHARRDHRLRPRRRPAHPRQPLRQHDRGNPPARRPRRLRPVPPRGGPRPERQPRPLRRVHRALRGCPCLGATTSRRSSCSAPARS